MEQVDEGEGSQDRLLRLSERNSCFVRPVQLKPILSLLESGPLQVI